jgi:hypothetical protein
MTKENANWLPRQYKGAAAVGTLLVSLLLSTPGHAGVFDSLAEWFDENMIDEQDGKMDVSDYLAGATGFLPVPIIITEPAVGFGAGAAVAYFHPPKEIDKDAHPHQGPPSITVGFAAGTDNGTTLYGAAHSGVWKNDHVRYLGAIAQADVNLKFYPDIGPQNASDDGIRFNVDGTFLYQQIQFRLRESNWWLGGNYLYINAKNTFDIGDEPGDDLPGPLDEFNQGGLSVFVEYDGRNTTFTPTKGLKGIVEFRNYHQRWGSDFNYDHISGSLHHFTPFGEYSSLGVRVDAEAVDGDVPFFGYPYVNLRGIPALRYQGEEVVTAELEYLWGITPRWTIALFAGGGKTTSVSAVGSGGETVAAGGAGFRYRIARKLGLQVGMDVARGPEETAVYLTVGSAW